MLIIWFNPDNDAYQKGTFHDLDQLRDTSDNRDRFNILFRFNRTTIRISDKILTVLNLNKKLVADSL